MQALCETAARGPEGARLGPVDNPGWPQNSVHIAPMVGAGTVKQIIVGKARR